jgi:hypothetical protein
MLAPTEIVQKTDSLVASSNFKATHLNLADIVEADPVDAVYGAQKHGLSWNYGTMENLTIQTFDFTESHGLTGAVLEAEVLGFSMAVDCELAQITMSQNTRSNGSSCDPLDYEDPLNIPSVSPLFANISNSHCLLTNVTLGDTPPSGFISKNTTSNSQGIFNYHLCNGGNASSTADYRFLLTMSEVTWQWMVQPLTKHIVGCNFTIAQSTGILCKPSYSIDKYRVTLVPFNETLLSAEKVPNTSTQLLGFDLKDLLDGIMNALAAWTIGEGGDDFVITPVAPMFELLSGLNNNSRQEAFLHEPILLQNLTTRALGGIGTQLAERYLKQKQDQQQFLSGIVTSTQQRLRVKRFTAELLLMTLGLLAITTILIIRIRPWNAAPCTTESLVSAAAILAASKRLRDLFLAPNSEAGTSQKLLENRDYQTVVDSEEHFKIEPGQSRSNRSDDFMQSEKTHTTSAAKQWWRPIATRKWFIGILLLVPLTLILVLELLQWMSNRNYGIIEVNTNDNYHLAIAYVPVSVMLLVAAMFNSLNFAVSVFAPFVALRRGHASAGRSISPNIISRLPISAFYFSLRNRYWATCFTISAAMISSFLTIVASGLYGLDTVQSYHEIHMQQLDSLDLSHIDLSLDDSLAGSTTKLIVLYNLSYPTWTYDNLVFPSFSAQIPKHLLGGNTTFDGISVSMKVPTLRPSLECSVAPPDNAEQDDTDYTVTKVFSSDGSNYIPETVQTPPGIYYDMNVTFPWSLSESNATLAKQLGSATWSSIFIIPNDTDTTVSRVPIGVASPMEWIRPVHGEDSSIRETTINSRLSTSDVDPSAANFGIAAGFASGSTQEVGGTWQLFPDLVVALCYQVVEEVQTEVTFTWPNMSLSQTNPPVPDESTARVILSNETQASTWFMSANTTSSKSSPHWFGLSLNTFLTGLHENCSTIQPYMNYSDPGVNMQSIQECFSTMPSMTGWFTTLQNGRDGQPLSELLGQKNQDKLLNASSQLYGRYAVQAINANMRSKDIQPGQKLSTYNATLSIPVLRLTQHKGPKIVLQVFLGIMVVCGAVAYFLVDTKEVLRESPSSIAGKMSLLARSQLCNNRDLLPEGAEWWDDKRRKNERLFDGLVFRLGWWPGKDGEPDWYGVDVDVRKEIHVDI